MPSTRAIVALLNCRGFLPSCPINTMQFMQNTHTSKFEMVEIANNFDTVKEYQEPLSLPFLYLCGELSAVFQSDLNQL